MTKTVNKNINGIVLRIGIFVMIIFSYFVGTRFEYMRNLIFHDSDVRFYRDICEENYPVFRIGFNNGSFKFSIFNEFNKLFYILYGLDFNSPTTFLDSKLCILQIFNREIELNLEKNGMAILLKEKSLPKNSPNQSSITFESEHQNEGTESENYGNIHFLKEGNFSLNLDDNLFKPTKITFDRKGPKVLIFHTHTRESYVPSHSFSEKSVVGVGETIAKELRNKYGVEVIHNATVHDKNGISGAYARSLETVSSILKSYPSIKVVLDIHRDGISDKEKFRPVVKVNNKSVAKVMMVVGTNYSGLEHPNWRQNLRFAISLQKKLETISPGITRPIYVSKNRYNEHVTNNAIILEVGGDGNTTNESQESAVYIAKALNDVINSK